MESYIYFWQMQVVIAISTTVIQSALGLMLASFFIRKIKLSGLYKILFYLPAICTSTIVGTVFSKIFETNRGYLNVILRALHLDFLCQQWLATPKTALACLLFVNIWQWTGYETILAIADERAVDPHVDRGGTFERGFKAFDSFEDGSNFEAWMTTKIGRAHV